VSTLGGAYHITFIATFFVLFNSLIKYVHIQDL